MAAAPVPERMAKASAALPTDKAQVTMAAPISMVQAAARAALTGKGQQTAPRGAVHQGAEPMALVTMSGTLTMGCMLTATLAKAQATAAAETMTTILKAADMNQKVHGGAVADAMKTKAVVSLTGWAMESAMPGTALPIG
jgi:hypothetical protein